MRNDVDKNGMFVCTAIKTVLLLPFTLMKDLLIKVYRYIKRIVKGDDTH